MAKAAPVLWFTGLSGAGKSTIARAVRQHLLDHEIAVELLDGDEVRAELSSDLGFSKADRDTQVRRLGYIAALLSRNGIIVLVSAISPYAQSRTEALRKSERGKEIFVDAPLSVVEQRDTKGLYAKARNGEITGLTGVDDPYEAPLHADLVLKSGAKDIQSCVHETLELLLREGIAVNG